MEFIRKMFGEYTKYFQFQYLLICGFYLPTLMRLTEDSNYFVSVLTYLLVVLLLTIPSYIFFCIVAYITDKFI